MQEIEHEVRQWRAEGVPAAIATVVRIEGTAPRPLGAKLAVSETGGFAGSVSGGCVEGAVIGEALEAMTEQRPRLLTYGIADDVLFDVGLACGGTIDVFVQPLVGETERVFRRLDQLRTAEEPVVLATAVGPAPIAGRQLLVLEDGSTEGDLGFGPLNDRAIKDALDLLGRGKPGHRSYGDLTPGDWGGPANVFFEVFAPAPRLVIFGAVHQAVPLAQIAKICGFHVTVADGREAFANRERFPDADDVIVAWPAEAAEQIKLNPRAYVAILTHDQKFDEPAILAAIAAKCRYIGAIGSRKTRQEQRERLAKRGIDREALARIRGPIGLDLGAVTPEETAISILGEIIAVRHGRSGAPLYQLGGPIHAETAAG